MKCTPDLLEHRQQPVPLTSVDRRRRKKHGESPVMIVLWLKVKLESLPREIALSPVPSLRELADIKAALDEEQMYSFRLFSADVASLSLRAHAQGYQSPGQKARSNPASPQTFLSLPTTPLHGIVQFQQQCLYGRERNAARSDSLLND